MGGGAWGITAHSFVFKVLQAGLFHFPALSDPKAMSRAHCLSPLLIRQRFG